MRTNQIGRNPNMYRACAPSTVNDEIYLLNSLPYLLFGLFRSQKEIVINYCTVLVWSRSTRTVYGTSTTTPYKYCNMFVCFSMANEIEQAKRRTSTESGEYSYGVQHDFTVQYCTSDLTSSNKQLLSERNAYSSPARPQI